MARSSEKLIPEDSLEKIIEKLKAIGHPDRLQIVNIVMNGECQVGEIVKALGKKQPIISQQLSKLRLSGVLKSKRHGHYMYYSFADKNIKKIIAAILSEV